MKKKMFCIGITILFVSGIVLSLLYFGIVHFNNPSKVEYPLKGIDVSSYQGDIDWKKISKHDLKFAFIKATEGSSFVDKCFNYNWIESNQTKLYIGAYHFFSFESSGKTQADNYISTVGELYSYNLPPVIDIEYYNKELKVDVQDLRKEIIEMASILENHYKKTPILYVTKDSYNDIIANYIEGYPIWIRNVFGKPSCINKWSLWQYSNRHVLTGYKEAERYIDMNVYNGGLIEFLTEFSLEEKE